MKSIKLAMLTGALLMMLNTGNVFAQTAGAGAMAASAPSAKSIRMANRQLAKKVRQALSTAKPAIPMESVVVLAKKGVVSLVGEVESEDQVARAATIAQGVAGVASVNNQLGIEERGE